jgi:hypothetical protein
MTPDEGEPRASRVASTLIRQWAQQTLDAFLRGEPIPDDDLREAVRVVAWPMSP